MRMETLTDDIKLYQWEQKPFHSRQNMSVRLLNGAATLLESL